MAGILPIYFHPVLLVSPSLVSNTILWFLLFSPVRRSPVSKEMTFPGPWAFKAIPAEDTCPTEKEGVGYVGDLAKKKCISSMVLLTFFFLPFL